MSWYCYPILFLILLVSIYHQAWKLCHALGISFNFSHASLNSEKACQALNVLVHDKLAFYAEITRRDSEHSVVLEVEEVAEDTEKIWDLHKGGDDVEGYHYYNNVVQR